MYVKRNTILLLRLATFHFSKSKSIQPWALSVVRFHDLRHTNVALRIEQSQNIKYIQSQMGHASIQTTLDRYGHLIKEVNQEQAEKLDSILVFCGAEESGKPFVRRLLEKEEKETKKGLEKASKPLISLVAGAGFEPTTFGL